MTKADLRTGHIITCRNGYEYLILKDCCDEVICGHRDNTICVNLTGSGQILFNTITDDLRDTSGKYEWEIVKVDVLLDYKDFTNLTEAIRYTLWKRTEKKKYTYKQLKEILGEEFEIVKEV